MTETARRIDPPTVWTVPETFRSIYSHAVEVVAGARVLFVSGQFGVSPDGDLLAGFEAQLEQAMDNVEALVAASGMAMADLVKITYYLTRSEDLRALGEIRRRRWAAREPPSVTVLIVAGLARRDCLVEVEAVAATR